MTKLISSAEIDEAMEAAMDEVGPEHWHTFKRKPGVRHLFDALHDAQTHIEAIEEAALIKARADGQKAVRAGLGDLLKDMHSGKALGINVGEDAPDSLRKAGAL